MSDPMIDPTELGTYLNDPDIDEVRALQLIGQAQTLCQSIISPLPDVAAVVVMRVAARAYTSILSPRQQQLAASGGQFLGTFGGGVYLTDFDTADLRRLTGGGGAFSIDILPTGYVAPVPAWVDVNDWDQPA